MKPTANYVASECSINIAPSKHALSSINLFSQLPLSSAWLESGRVLSPPSRAEPVQVNPRHLGAELHHLTQIGTVFPIPPSSTQW